MKVAIVHDWLTGLRGGERCLEEFLRLYPQADIYTLIHKRGSTSELIDDRVRQVSWLNQLPNATKWYRYYLPFFPAATRSLRMENYDLVVSLSHAAAKNVCLPHETTHICYCFTPMRYIWDQAEQYFGKKGVISMWPLLRRLRKWDRRGSEGVTRFVSISKFVSARVRRFYGRSSEVIYPPVDCGWIEQRSKLFEGKPRQKKFLYAGALVPYKRVDAIIRAFKGSGHRLVVAGHGPEEARLKEIASSEVEFLGRVSDQELADLYHECRALIFPAREDFGMIPIEALSAGTPVISLYEGATRESLKQVKMWEGPSKEQCYKATGIAVRSSTHELVSSLRKAVDFFIEHEEHFSQEICRQHAKRFSPEHFRSSWNEVVRQVMNERKSEC